MTIYSLYYRYQTLCTKIEDNLDEAKAILQGLEDWGAASTLGVIDIGNQIAFVPTVYSSGDPQFENEWARQKKELIEGAQDGLNLNISRFKFERYPTFPGSD